jgi:hypothetical protein
VKSNFIALFQVIRTIVNKRTVAIDKHGAHVRRVKAVEVIGVRGADTWNIPPPGSRERDPIARVSVHDRPNVGEPFE